MTTQTERDLRVRLAACYRIFAMLGWVEMIYNHITVRLPGTDGHFLINPFGLHYSEVTASNLLKIEVWRPEAGKPARYADDDFVVAIATDAPGQLPEPTLRPVLDLNDPDAVAQWLVDNGDRFDYDAEKYA